MSGNPRTLQELVDLAQQRQDNASLLELSRRAAKGGFAISNATLNLMSRGTYHATPQAEAVEALSFLARVPFKVARRAAGLSEARPSFADQVNQVENINRLSAEEREALLELMRVMLAGRKSGDTDDPR